MFYFRKFILHSYYSAPDSSIHCGFLCNSHVILPTILILSICFCSILFCVLVKPKVIGLLVVSTLFSFRNLKIMASSPITSLQIGGETVETVADFIFLGSKITAEMIAAMK